MSRDSFQKIFIRMFAPVALVLLAATSAWSQSYKVIYNFAYEDSISSSGLTLDAAGNAYGTMQRDGQFGINIVYELSPTSGYHLLYQFTQKGLDGAQTQGNLAMDPAGNLYGTTFFGGANGDGVVYKLSPPSSGVGRWTETVLYSFCSQSNCADGANPPAGVILDSAGNLYGTTTDGGDQSCKIAGYTGCGVVFELSSTQSGWTENVLHTFSGGNDGSLPLGGLIFDAAGNLYGTTYYSGSGGGGTAFEMSPSVGGWTESILYSFNADSGSADGCFPVAGLALDAAGDLYGTTPAGGSYQPNCSNGYGTVFELMPDGFGGWTESILYSFAGGDYGEEPQAGLAIDPSGNLYGTTYAGGNTKACFARGCGTVFELTPGANGQWRERLYRFNGTLGSAPTTPVILDSAGDVYGTTTAGGIPFDGGVIFKITQ